MPVSPQCPSGSYGRKAVLYRCSRPTTQPRFWLQLLQQTTPSTFMISGCLALSFCVASDCLQSSLIWDSPLTFFVLHAAQNAVKRLGKYPTLIPCSKGAVWVEGWMQPMVTAVGWPPGFRCLARSGKRVLVGPAWCSFQAKAMAVINLFPQVSAGCRVSENKAEHG